MKRKNGFTLIELLAVIIILGILMIIAIPSVTQYINNSRKSAYVDTAKEIISGTRNLVNKGDLEMFDTNATYYIPIEAIGTENGQKSPYGDFEEAYVVVTYNGSNYTYYWLSVDETGQGVKNITRADKLDEDSIESDIKKSDIASQVTTVGVGNRTTIKILDDQNDYKSWKTDITLSNTSNNVSEEGASGNGGGNTPTVNKICRRAATGTEHTATCTATDTTYYCSGAGYNNGTTANTKNTTTITYGTIKSEGNELASGDALDCDVNGDGTYDSATERFYYVTSSGTGSEEKAVLIYYTNVYQYNDTLTATRTQKYAYDSSNQNYHGPRTGYAQLPSTTQWSNSQIIAPVANRQIVTETGTTSTSGGTIETFTYTNKVARFLTYQEVVEACGSGTVTTTGYLDGCNYLMENIEYYETGSGTYGYWLETPGASYSSSVWFVTGNYRSVNNYRANDTSFNGVRPAIEVLKSNISY